MTKTDDTILIQRQCSQAIAFTHASHKCGCHRQRSLSRPVILTLRSVSSVAAVFFAVWIIHLACFILSHSSMFAIFDISSWTHTYTHPTIERRRRRRKTSDDDYLILSRQITQSLHNVICAHIFVIYLIWIRTIWKKNIYIKINEKKRATLERRTKK